MVTMMTQTNPARPLQARQPLRTVAVVSRQPYAQILDTVLEAGDYDVVFIESVGHAYSQIKQAAPHVVILCLDVDDVEGFQVLSMLKMDDATSRIPIVTYVAIADANASHERSFAVDRGPSSPPIILSGN